MAAITKFTKIAEERIAGVIAEHLDIPEDEDETLYAPLTDALTEAMKSVLQEMQNSHDAEIKKLQAVTKSKTDEIKVKAVKGKGKTKTKSDGTKPANKYAWFVRWISRYNSDTHPEVNGEQLITPTSNFSNPGAQCAKKYTASKVELDVEGKEMPLGTLINTIKQQFDNNMTVTGMVWGLLAKDVREQLADSVADSVE